MEKINAWEWKWDLDFPPPVVLQGTDDLETPEWNEKNYIPSTSRGARAPHVFLRDGDTSIHDLLGFDYSLVDFTTEGNFASSFKEAASHLGIPIATVHLQMSSMFEILGTWRCARPSRSSRCLALEQGCPASLFG